MFKLTWDTSSLTFPEDPERIEETNPSVIETVPLPATQPFLLSMGLATKELNASGILNDPTKTREQMKTDYIDVLRGLIHKLVGLETDDAMYDGDYIVSEFKSEERKGVVGGVFWYNLKLIQGSQTVVL